MSNYEEKSSEEKHKESEVDEDTLIIARLAEYYCVTFSNDLKGFFTDNSDKFAQITKVEEVEYTPEMYSLFKEYEGIVETHLKDFCTKENKGKKEIFNLIKRNTKNNQIANLLVELILCTTDFRLFCEMMFIKVEEAKIIDANLSNFPEEKQTNREAKQ